MILGDKLRMIRDEDRNKIIFDDYYLATIMQDI